MTDPRTECGLEDYRFDQRENPERHPAAVNRLLGRRRRPVIDRSGGELPGRKVDAGVRLCPRNFLRRAAFMGQGLIARGDRAPAKHARSVRAGGVPLSSGAGSGVAAMRLVRPLTGTVRSPRGSGSCGGMFLVMLALSGLLTPRRRSTPGRVTGNRSGRL